MCECRQEYQANVQDCTAWRVFKPRRLVLSRSLHTQRPCLGLRRIAVTHLCEATMTQDNAPETDDLGEEYAEDDFESAADVHRMAAHHFTAAAKHHFAAAIAEDEGDPDKAARHTFLAYRHQLNAVQYAEIAAMDSEGPEDEFAGAELEE